MSDASGADYRTINHANWESRVPVHAASADYRLDQYIAEPDLLSEIVEFDRPRLGDISGLDVVHLQCHMGNDSLSLARLGANVTGLDFSGAALVEARRVSAAGGPHVEYVEADVYDACEVLGRGRFDLVYTGIGALCWLPSIARWAEVVAGLLKPGGQLFIREGHPVLWALDDPRDDGLVVLAYPYFETAGVQFTEEDTYVEQTEALASPDIVHFNHGFAEIFNALWSAGMEITLFEEHTTVPWNPMGAAMHDIGDGEYQLVDRPERLPCSYTLRARLR
jgi:SAM-dependent methyltransferase